MGRKCLFCRSQPGPQRMVFRSHQPVRRRADHLSDSARREDISGNGYAHRFRERPFPLDRIGGKPAYPCHLRCQPAGCAVDCDGEAGALKQARAPHSLFFYAHFSQTTFIAERRRHETAIQNPPAARGSIRTGGNHTGISAHLGECGLCCGTKIHRLPRKSSRTESV